ncbi:hypothetical protein BDW02DRAFT_580797 [Decorospora gaudefroyi]|uniref:Uncharacterized protein n=1 Tax=Decorospora gaudefroyi TaxID=184978 RepID=A0A6A5K5N7_9PLEO|nr:hypothetical protein BDW02DRAFT_580797 [Decorospora gaudefroyi]
MRWPPPSTSISLDDQCTHPPERSLIDETKIHNAFISEKIARRNHYDSSRLPPQAAPKLPFTNVSQMVRYDAPNSESMARRDNNNPRRPPLLAAPELALTNESQINRYNAPNSEITARAKHPKKRRRSSSENKGPAHASSRRTNSPKPLPRPARKVHEVHKKKTLMKESPKKKPLKKKSPKKTSLKKKSHRKISLTRTASTSRSPSDTPTTLNYARLFTLPQEIRGMIFTYLWDNATLYSMSMSMRPAPACFPCYYAGYDAGRRPQWVQNFDIVNQLSRISEKRVYNPLQQIALSFYEHYPYFEIESLEDLDAFMGHDFFGACLEVRPGDALLRALTIRICIRSAHAEFMHLDEVQRRLVGLYRARVWSGPRGFTLHILLWARHHTVWLRLCQQI